MMHALGVGWSQADPAHIHTKQVEDDEECRLLLLLPQFHSRESLLASQILLRALCFGFVLFSGVYLMLHAKLAIGIRRVYLMALSPVTCHVSIIISVTLSAKQPCCCTRTKSPLLCLCPLPYCRVCLTWLCLAMAPCYGIVDQSC